MSDLKLQLRELVINSKAYSYVAELNRPLYAISQIPTLLCVIGPTKTQTLARAESQVQAVRDEMDEVLDLIHDAQREEEK